MALDAFLLVIGMLALGKASAASGRFPDSAAAVLNRFVLDVCLPAAVLRYAARLELDLALLRVIAVPWLLCAATAVAGLLGGEADRPRRRPDGGAAALRAAGQHLVPRLSADAGDARRRGSAVCGGLRPVRIVSAALHLGALGPGALWRRPAADGSGGRPQGGPLPAVRGPRGGADGDAGRTAAARGGSAGAPLGCAPAGRHLCRRSRVALPVAARCARPARRRPRPQARAAAARGVGAGAPARTSPGSPVQPRCSRAPCRR